MEEIIEVTEAAVDECVDRDEELGAIVYNDPRTLESSAPLA